MHSGRWLLALVLSLSGSVSQQRKLRKGEK